MIRPPTAKEIEIAVKARIAELAPSLARYAYATNPQEIEIRNYTSGQLSALRSIENMIQYRRRNLI